ncbi:DUF4349 domain-containing protein [Streptomyces sp. MS19]|uniref:DUF4349 domain-containing protein n=1 Tax=Streptomyces sp. MS19 TaxID=3385972 RepID=UPI0039A3F7DB
MTHRTGPVRRAALAAVPLLGALLLAGCTGGGSDGGGSMAREGFAADDRADDRAGDSAGDSAAEPAPEGSSDADGQDGAVERADDGAAAEALLIRTARLVVAADDVPGAYEGALSAVAAAGGFVSAENTVGEPTAGDWSEVTLRVPEESYEDLLTDLAALGELRSREVTTEDVTEEVVDVESRLATQRESVARVRALMEEAVSIRDIVDLEAELSRRQADLESLESRSESLRGRVAMATVTLELHEMDTPVDEPADSDDDPSIPGALAGGWDVFVAALVWTGAALAAVLPFAAATALVVLVVRLARRRLPQRPAREPEPAPADQVFRAPGA